MAFLGGQMLITLGMLSLFHKFGGRISFARWLIADRLHFYSPPLHDELKEHAGLVPAKNHKRKKWDKYFQLPSNFNVPKKTDFPIYAFTLRESDLVNLPYYIEYQWLLDFAVGSLFVYLITELYYLMFSTSQEVNLSLIWCCLVIGFTTKILHSLTSSYFKTNVTMGERNICLTFGGFYFLLSMFILIVSDNFLEFGLDTAYRSFNSTATDFLIAHKISHAVFGPTSQIMFRFWLTIWSGLIGVYLIFPGLRLAQMHKDALKLTDSRWWRGLFHFQFVAPLFILLLWVRPIARSPLVERSWAGRPPLMNADQFDNLRLTIAFLLPVSRLLLLRKYVQAYLNTTLVKLSNLQKQSGKIRYADLQRIFAQVLSYVCGVILQFSAPLLMTMFFILLLKTLGHYTFVVESDWLGLMGKPGAEFTWKTLRLIFNPIVFRGLLNYMTWWLTFSSFLSSLAGFVYHSNFAL